MIAALFSVLLLASERLQPLTASRRRSGCRRASEARRREDLQAASRHTGSRMGAKKRLHDRAEWSCEGESRQGDRRDLMTIGGASRRPVELLKLMGDRGLDQILVQPRHQRRSTPELGRRGIDLGQHVGLAPFVAHRRPVGLDARRRVHIAEPPLAAAPRSAGRRRRPRRGPRSWWCSRRDRGSVGHGPSPCQSRALAKLDLSRPSRLGARLAIDPARPVKRWSRSGKGLPVRSRTRTEEANWSDNHMSKRSSAKYKLDRRMGENVFGRPKSPVNRREYGPGQHGQRRKSRSRTSASSCAPSRSSRAITATSPKSSSSRPSSRPAG